MSETVDALMTNPEVRFGLKVINDNGHHVSVSFYAAIGGQHLGYCGQLVLTTVEYAAFRELLAPRLTDRSDPSTRRPLERDATNLGVPVRPQIAKGDRLVSTFSEKDGVV